VITIQRNNHSTSYFIMLAFLNWVFLISAAAF